MIDIIEHRIAELTEFRDQAEAQLRATQEWRELFAIEHRLAELRSLINPPASVYEYTEGTDGEEV